MAEEILRRARHGVGIAHVGTVDAHRARVGQRGDELAQRILAARHQAEDGALRRVFARESLA
ncbi:hypothetical protein D3C87_2096830 [compost metagenome]